MGGDSQHLKKKFDYQRQSGGNQGYKYRRFPGEKIKQKGNFLQQKHSSVKKTQQGRNLYQGNCSSTTFRWTFTRNSSITPVKRYTPIGAKIFPNVKVGNFPLAGRLQYFVKHWKKLTSNPEILEWVSGLKIDFILEPF